jgi:hypothetical protein
VPDEVRRVTEAGEHLGDVLRERGDRVSRWILRTTRLVLSAQVDRDGPATAPGEWTEDRQEVFLAAGVARHEQNRGSRRDVLRRLRHERRKVSRAGRDAGRTSLGRQLQARRNAHVARLPTSRLSLDEPAAVALAGSSPISQTAPFGQGCFVLSSAAREDAQ